MKNLFSNKEFAETCKLARNEVFGVSDILSDYQLRNFSVLTGAQHELISEIKNQFLTIADLFNKLSVYSRYREDDF